MLSKTKNINEKPVFFFSCFPSGFIDYRIPYFLSMPAWITLISFKTYRLYCDPWKCNLDEYEGFLLPRSEKTKLTRYFLHRNGTPDSLINEMGAGTFNIDIEEAFHRHTFSGKAKRLRQRVSRVLSFTRTPRRMKRAVSHLPASGLANADTASLASIEAPSTSDLRLAGTPMDTSSTPTRCQELVRLWDLEEEGSFHKGPKKLFRIEFGSLDVLAVWSTFSIHNEN